MNLTGSLSAAWEMARTEVKKAQSKQKYYYDQRARGYQLRVGDRVCPHAGSKEGQGTQIRSPLPWALLSDGTLSE